MRTTERVVLYTAIACLAAATFMRGTERHAVATAATVASDLGPADAVILTGKDSEPEPEPNMNLDRADLDRPADPEPPEYDPPDDPPDPPDYEGGA